MKRLIILQYAEVDIKESVSYYKEIGTGLEKDFVSAVEASFREILKSPEAYPIAKYDIRKYVLSRFQYCVYYVIRTEVLYILAVFHDKRNPKDWHKRRIKRS